MGKLIKIEDYIKRKKQDELDEEKKRLLKEIMENVNNVKRKS